MLFLFLARFIRKKRYGKHFDVPFNESRQYYRVFVACIRLTPPFSSFFSRIKRNICDILFNIKETPFPVHFITTLLFCRFISFLPNKRHEDWGSAWIVHIYLEFLSNTSTKWQKNKMHKLCFVCVWHTILLFRMPKKEEGETSILQSELEEARDGNLAYYSLNVTTPIKLLHLWHSTLYEVMK